MFVILKIARSYSSVIEAHCIIIITVITNFKQQKTEMGVIIYESVALKL